MKKTLKIKTARPGKSKRLFLPKIFIKYRKYRNYMRYVFPDLL
jgi:hypothetical protein